MFNWYFRKFGNLAYYSAIGAIVAIPVSLLFSYLLYSYLDTLPQKYCYQTFYGPDNMALIINNMAYKQEYLAYYEKLKSSRQPVMYNFNSFYAPLGGKVHIVGYTEDSSLVKIMIESYFERGKFFFYVVPDILHERPPVITYFPPKE